MSSNDIADGICNKSEGFSHPSTGEEIVISGLAGRFPKSDNIKLLQENLMNKIDLITDDAPSMKSAFHGASKSIGKANNTEKLDAAFFGISAKQADKMDPKGRMLLEHTYEAIIDAGINPRQLHGTKTGVFIGTCASESNNVTVFDAREGNELGILGGSHYMMANRISSWFGFRGPSTVIDTACSSSLSATEHAYAEIRHGRCDAAIVGGANLVLIPNAGLQLAHLGMLSPDGRCKVFDETANGYVRSDTIAVALLQKAKNAKRIYAYMIHAKSNNDGYTDEGITVPSSRMQASLLKELYTECGVSPATIKYVEAHATSTQIGDSIEMTALEEVFLDGRTTPLLIGSVKSNMGHAEPASGLCAITKVVIAMESGYIPPNLHYKHPHKQLKGLHEERMRVVTEPTAWQGGNIGINSSGYGGSNSHILLKSHEKEKINGGSPKDDLPRLVVVSGRSREAVWFLLNDLKSRPVDVEYVRLLHDIHELEIHGHLYRGFTILPARESSESVPQSCHQYQAVKRPVLFVFSEVRPAWTGVGESLLRFPLFSEAIERCDLALKPWGVDVFNILRNKNTKTFDNFLNVIVGMTAIQVGLVDLLTSVEIAPDNVISNSVGELMHAYTDGCLTTEQTILAAYFYGLACLEMNETDGSMATSSLGNSELQTLYSNDIKVARSDVSDGLTGLTKNELAEPIKDRLTELLKPKISAEKPQCNDTAHDKRYITEVGPKLLANLRKIITHPKPRSFKWLSNSVLEDKWTSESAGLCSAEYLTNILLNPVSFEERLLKIPRNAILVEMTPQGLLSQALRKFSTAKINHITLTNSKQYDNVAAVLYALGKLYEMGLNPRLRSLYPEVQYPVSRGTSMISPLIRWNHSKNWDISATKPIAKLPGTRRKIKIDANHEFSHQTTGHVIDGRNLVPAAGYLILIWETLAMMEGKIFTDVSVVFEDVEFIFPTTIPQDGDVVLELVVDRGTGNFTVLEGDEAIVTGTVRSVSNPIAEFVRDTTTSVDDNVDSEEMSARDVYKTFRIRGYQYSGLFRSITKANVTGTRGHISWHDNWVAFIENMLQMNVLGSNTEELLVPTFINKFAVDVQSHWDLIAELGAEHPELPVKVLSDHGAIISGGMEIRGLQVARINRRKLCREPVHEKSLFVVHRDQAESTLEPLIRLAVHIAVENQIGSQIKIIEFIDESNDVSIIECLASSHIQTIFNDLPTLQADVTVIASGGNLSLAELPSSVKFESQLPQNDENVLLTVAHELIASKNKKLLNMVQAVTTERGFILAIEPLKVNANFVMIQEHFDVILEKRTDKKSIILLRKKFTPPVITHVIRVNNDEYTWLHKLQAALQAESYQRNNVNNRILLVSEGNFECGIEGLVNCLRKEPGGKHIQELFIQDIEAPEFSLDNSFYREQLKLDLVHNVLRPGGFWGSYRWLAFHNLVPRIVHHAYVEQETPGNLTSFQWVEGRIQPGLNVHETCNIYYSSLNFLDIMLATGKLKCQSTANEKPIDERGTGVEYSGVNATDGRRVMGIISSGALSNVCIPDPNLQWDVPNDWTLEDAATVPVAYGTSYYSLYVIGQMRKGAKVLIHSGCGGVGQAAITLALHEGCEVFTTVGTTSKRKFIKEHFPQIDDDHIGNSRNTSFEEMILRKTQGRGVDIVLNSLTGEKLRASLRCLTRGGRFLEIGKVDVANTQIGMEIFSREIHFHSVHLDRVLNGTVEEKQRLKSLIEKGNASGVVEPLGRTVFTKEKIEAAFRHMTTGRHIGKVLIKIRNDDGGCTSLFHALPRFYCLSGSSYLIHGGLGGFGLELAEWLVHRGATRLVLTSRRGITTGYQRRRLHFWKTSGVKTLIIAGKDAATEEGCEAILKEAAAIGPVDAIFNLAVLLNDRLCENQTMETFQSTLRVKAVATKQLDKMSRILCPHLRQFVVFSSMTCGRGNAGQTNYGMANSIMERICETRVADGLPALAIEWGPIGDVGVVAELHEDDEVVVAGTMQQGIHSCLEQLDQLLLQESPILSNIVIAEKKVATRESQSIVDAVMKILGMENLEGVSQHTSLAELGLDSITAQEVRQLLQLEIDMLLPNKEIRSLNFAKISELSERQKIDGTSIEGKSCTASRVSDNMNLLARTIAADDFDLETCVSKHELSNPSVLSFFSLSDTSCFEKQKQACAHSIG